MCHTEFHPPESVMVAPVELVTTCQPAWTESNHGTVVWLYHNISIQIGECLMVYVLYGLWTARSWVAGKRQQLKVTVCGSSVRHGGGGGSILVVIAVNFKLRMVLIWMILINCLQANDGCQRRSRVRYWCYRAIQGTRWIKIHLAAMYDYLVVKILIKWGGLPFSLH